MAVASDQFDNLFEDFSPVLHPHHLSLPHRPLPLSALRLGGWPLRKAMASGTTTPAAIIGACDVRVRYGNLGFGPLDPWTRMSNKVLERARRVHRSLHTL